MEILMNILIDFILFGIIEAYIFCKFFEVVSGCRKFKWWEILLFGLIEQIIVNSFPPIIFQLICIGFMTIFISYINKFSLKEAIKISIISTFFTLILETTYCMSLELIGKDIFYMNELTMFIYGIPAKIIEFILIIKCGDKMRKWFWIGKAEKPAKPVK
ncbi:MAG: hypothetical protein ACRDDY_19465 [Clostridium sp.]|uniref:hypothetical protein n=1 Tax=Clostridium sp. TaxID=1506 RepID=UPI003EE7B3BE